MNGVEEHINPERARKPLVIWGAKGPALIVADIIRLRGEYDIVGYLDNLNPERKNTSFGGAKILGAKKNLTLSGMLGSDISSSLFKTIQRVCAWRRG